MTTATTGPSPRREALRTRVLEVLKSIAPEATVVNGGADLREELDLDSMDFLHFVVGLHEKTGVEIPESDYRLVSTLDGAVGYLLDRMDAPGTRGAP